MQIITVNMKLYQLFFMQIMFFLKIRNLIILLKNLNLIKYSTVLNLYDKFCVNVKMILYQQF